MKPKLNDTVELVRSLPWNQAKQPGRRYGPAPKKPRGPGAGPMDVERRLKTYARANRRHALLGQITTHQFRQLARMAERNGEWTRRLTRPEPGAGRGRRFTYAATKGRATPKRGAR